MGSEAEIRIEVDGVAADVRAMLETDELLIRGELKMRMPIRELAVDHPAPPDGVLRLRWRAHELALPLGVKRARTWAERIRKPKSVVDKLGIKAAQRVTLIGPFDRQFVDELERRSGNVAKRLRKESDIILFAADAKNDLERLPGLRQHIRPNGAIWVVRPKGSKSVTEGDVLEAGREAELIDVKVVRFSETHTAEKFIIPVTKR
jgi:hypothetical protein